VPKFVKKFGSIGLSIDRAIGAYAREVRARTFPAVEHTYTFKDDGEGGVAASTRVTKKPKTPST
jgi:3-methyl-2-oxobutanoate hydroxymethyltransferase